MAKPRIFYTVVILFAMIYALYLAYFEWTLKNTIGIKWKRETLKSVSIKRFFVASNESEIYILGAAGINSTTERVWDKFNVYGQRHLLKKEKALVCCLLYHDGQILQIKIAENRPLRLNTQLPLFNVVCDNTRHSHKDEQRQTEVPIGISVIFDGNSCR